MAGSTAAGLGYSQDDGAALVHGHIDRARDGLMGGRGNGADAIEIAMHTRDRPLIAGRSVAEGLAATARQTAWARGDVEALVIAIRASTAELAEGLQVLVEAYSPRRVLGRIGVAAGAAAGRWTDRAGNWATPAKIRRAAAVALLAAVAVIVSRRRRSGSSSRRGPGPRP